MVTEEKIILQMVLITVGTIPCVFFETRVT